MKTALLLLLLSFRAFSQDALSHYKQNADSPNVISADPAIAQLRAENEALKAQLAQLRLEFQYEMQLCQAPDLMRARLAAREAEAKKAVVDKKEPPK